ncbi:MAG: hypothetical protein Q4G62_06185 [Pseudomonadota bacterium]|nr:hypothetical protein [Pseudomonadota bacterium]
MNIKKILIPFSLLGSALLLSGCYTPYASGTLGTRVGSGGYVSGSVGGYPHGTPYGYRNYGGSGLQVYGYDRYGSPIYRSADGRLVQGHDPYRNRGVYVTPGYRYPAYGYPRAYPSYGYPRYNYPPQVNRYPPRGQRPLPPDRGGNHGPGTSPPVTSPRPPRNSSPLGNVVREERQRRDQTRDGRVRQQEP